MTLSARKIVDDEISQIIKDNQIVLFMKGTPEHPRCSFSARAYQALIKVSDNFLTVDVLSNDLMRQSLSCLYNWPTIPQLFVGGELIGGADIIIELQTRGQLQDVISGNKPLPVPDWY